MLGCVNAEPSAAGCGVSAKPPPGKARRLSFSTPQRMPVSWSAVNACTRLSRKVWEIVITELFRITCQGTEGSTERLITLVRLLFGQFLRITPFCASTVVI